MESIPLLLAFAYGLLSFLSPCVIPLVPVYLASLAGSEVLEANANRPRLPLFLHSLSFVVGFSVVFTLWGAGAGLLGAALAEHAVVVRKVAGALLIAFGVLMVAALRLPWLSYERRPSLPLGRSGGYLRSLLIGAVFPVAWIPCTSWVLAGILTLAATSETAGQGAYLLVIYSLGLGVPFLALGIALDFVAPRLKTVNRAGPWLYVASGLLLIIVGALVLSNWLVWF